MSNLLATPPTNLSGITSPSAKRSRKTMLKEGTPRGNRGSEYPRQPQKARIGKKAAVCKNKAPVVAPAINNAQPTPTTDPKSTLRLSSSVNPPRKPLLSGLPMNKLMAGGQKKSWLIGGAGDTFFYGMLDSPSGMEYARKACLRLKVAIRSQIPEPEVVETNFSAFDRAMEAMAAAQSDATPATSQQQVSTSGPNLGPTERATSPSQVPISSSLALPRIHISPLLQRGSWTQVDSQVNTTQLPTVAGLIPDITAITKHSTQPGAGSSQPQSDASQSNTQVPKFANSISGNPVTESHSSKPAASSQSGSIAAQDLGPEPLLVKFNSLVVRYGLTNPPTRRAVNLPSDAASGESDANPAQYQVPATPAIKFAPTFSPPLPFGNVLYELMAERSRGGRLDRVIIPDFVGMDEVRRSWASSEERHW